MPDQTFVTASASLARARQARMVGEPELALVTDAVADIAPDWSVELSGADSLDRCLLVMPEGADDALGPTFLLHVANAGFRLDQLRFDEITPIAEGSDLPEIMAILRSRLAGLTLVTLPMRVSRH